MTSCLLTYRPSYIFFKKKVYFKSKELHAETTCFRLCLWTQRNNILDSVGPFESRLGIRLNVVGKYG